MKFFNKYKSHYIALLHLGLPIVIGQMGMILVGFADTLMVGHYNVESLAASSFVNSVFNLVIIFGTGFAYGLTPIIGSLFGSSEFPAAGRMLKNSLLANTVIAILMILAMTVLYLNVEKLGQPKELIPLIKPYFIILLSTLIFVMLFNAFKQFVDGITDTRTSMWILLGGQCCTYCQ